MSDFWKQAQPTCSSCQQAPKTMDMKKDLIHFTENKWVVFGGGFVLGAILIALIKHK